MVDRNSVDPCKMAIEGSSTFAFEESSSTSLSPQGSVADTENIENEFETATPNGGVKRKATDKPAKSGSKGKKRRDEQTATSQWQTSFLQLMDRRTEQDNIRFERSTELLRELSVPCLSKVS